MIGRKTRGGDKLPVEQRVGLELIPTILTSGGFQFIVFTSDHRPPHVPVRREGKLAKLQLEPLMLVHAGGFNAREQRRIIQIAREHRSALLREWQRLHPEDERDDE